MKMFRRIKQQQAKTKNISIDLWKQVNIKLMTVALTMNFQLPNTRYNELLEDLDMDQVSVTKVSARLADCCVVKSTFRHVIMLNINKFFSTKFVHMNAADHVCYMFIIENFLLINVVLYNIVFDYFILHFI
jgi:hypothetical protein